MEILILIAKSIGILSLFYVIYISILHKNTLFTANRHFLIAGIIAALTLPFLEFTQVTEIVLPSQQVFDTANVVPLSQVEYLPIATTVEVPTIDWWQIALLIYIAGVIVMCIRLGMQLFSLRSLISSGTVVQRNAYTYVTVTNNIAPFSFFSYIVYNPELHTLEELEMILAHEQIHAGQRHSIDILITQIILALHWCNPLAWLYKQSLEQNLEYIADAHAITRIKNPQQYQRTLVKVSSPSIRPALTNQFYQSFIKKRIVMLNTPQSGKHHLWKLGLIIPLVSFFLYSFNVKEVVTYVEEDNTAFAKAETTKNPTNKGRDVFFIDRETTNDKLDRIEKYVTDHWKEVAIKFSKRSYTSENDLSAFTLQIQFDEEVGFVNKLSFNSKEIKQWDGYSLMVNTEREIVVMEQKDGTFINITPIKTTITDDKITSATEDTTIKKDSGTNESLGSNPVIVVNNNIVREKEKSFTADSITTLTPTQAVKKFGAKTQDSIRKLDNNVQLDTILTTRVSIQETYNFVITKNSTDQEIKTLAAILKDKHNATLKVSGIKRNRNQEIEKISIDLRDENGNNKNYTLKSSNPINDIYIYRNADGSTGMGSVNMQNNTRDTYDNKRASLEERRNTMMNTRDSMRTNMEARKQVMRARMEERRSLQGRAQVDSMRQDMLSRRDSMKMQMKERRENLKGDRENYKNNRQQRDMRYVTLDEKTYYFVVSPEGSKSFYDRWGKQIKEDTPLYQKLLDEASSTVSSLSQDKLMEQLPEDDILKSDSSDKPIYYVNDKKMSVSQLKEMDVAPNNILTLTVYKGEKAIELYGKEAVNGVVVIETKE
ncbi:M56 family metallopeptidase [uncultured Dokdonia sp.]|uniref:M56 family metallopeptidase n=1 Tax=uncultured Dokdonia sp. TaxID=575653 RepID=UPI0030EB8B39|tara:strand:+ start:70169 stop:72649 length:2481 start_codon:yes stop_codon:yes gene_type:complete